MARTDPMIPAHHSSEGSQLVTCSHCHQPRSVARARASYALKEVIKLLIVAAVTALRSELHAVRRPAHPKGGAPSCVG